MCYVLVLLLLPLLSALSFVARFQSLVLGELVLFYLWGVKGFMGFRLLFVLYGGFRASGFLLLSFRV